MQNPQKPAKPNKPPKPGSAGVVEANAGSQNTDKQEMSSLIVKQDTFQQAPSGDSDYIDDLPPPPPVPPPPLPLSPKRNGSSPLHERPLPQTTNSNEEQTNAKGPAPPPPPQAGSSGNSNAPPMTMSGRGSIREGVLLKMNREGKFDKCLFTLTYDSLVYENQNSATAITTNAASSATGQKTEVAKTIPLTTLLVLPLTESEYNGDNFEFQFKILSRQKSFIVRAKTKEEKGEWFTDIYFAAKLAQTSANMTALTVEDTAPIWSVIVSDCQICYQPFTFFNRKHHCRNCGKCVCEPCSKEKVRIPRLDEKKLFKVCNPCGLDIRNSREYGAVKNTPYSDI
eukprot:gene11853-15859_t